MRQIRNCATAMLNTGTSKCAIDFDYVKGALLVPHGTKLPAGLTGEQLEELCHEGIATRVYPITPFAEYAKEGGEPQTNESGYGGVQITGVSARTDTFTLDRFYPELNASLLRCMNQRYDAYFWDGKKRLYGVNDGTDTLAGFEMATIYPTATPHPTSSAQASLTVSFCYEDARASLENMDYVELTWDPRRYAMGLVEVELVKTAAAGNDYKLVEKVGGYDCTADYGAAIAAGAATVLSGATAATYNADAATLTITADGSATPALKSPKVLYAAGIKGIECV